MRFRIRAARRETQPRELLWLIWRRFSGCADLFSRADGERSQLSRIWFADFLIANADIVQRVVEGFRQGPGGVGMDLLMELEQSASRRI